jgi:hypothetical protein
MSNTTYFVQECPTCGRRLYIRVEHLGKRVVCQHCHGRLLARDPSNSPLSSSDSLLRRADELLQCASESCLLPRNSHPR